MDQKNLAAGDGDRGGDDPIAVVGRCPIGMWHAPDPQAGGDVDHLVLRVHRFSLAHDRRA